MSIPEGFVKHDRASPATDPWEPLYVRRTDLGSQLGVRVAEAHCNGRGFAHGGVIAALADNSMGMTVVLVAGRQSAVTVNLSLDYIGSAQIGQWLQVEPRFLKAGGTLGFADALVTADGETIAHASGTFRFVA